MSKAQQPPQPAFSTDAAAEQHSQPGHNQERAQTIPRLHLHVRVLCARSGRAGRCGHRVSTRARRAAPERNRPEEKLALILDIDETTLSNYRELSAPISHIIPAAFNAWIDAKQAPAIPGTLRLYKEAQRLGVNILFITGRPMRSAPPQSSICAPQGFDHWQELVMRPAAHGTQTIGEFKRRREAQIVAKGYTLASMLATSGAT